MYEERYGWHDREVPFAAIGLVCVGMAPFTGESPTMIVLMVAFGLLLVGVPTVAVVTGRVALRVDAHGVTLGRVVGVVYRREVHVPWPHIAELALFTADMGDYQMGHLGIRLRPGAPPPPGAPRPSGSPVRTVSGLYVAPEVLALSRAFQSWRLNRAALVAAVTAHAPGTPIVDLDWLGAPRRP
ncbi:hypothetical protein [Streptomyces sp. NPDC127098]|uniref:hypothetical protein n=1 Tax=Streptomyces sp. NPDC127098 TaxID=3347137 RepID=UPI00366989D7